MGYRRPLQHDPLLLQAGLWKPHSLHHDAVDPHLSGASGVVKNVDPGESQRDHEEADIISATPNVQKRAEQQERCLQEASKTDEW